MNSITSTTEDRELTSSERSLVHWLLENGTIEAIRYRHQLENARVAERCDCGCASIDFAINGIVPKKSEPFCILADYEWEDKDGNLFGVFIFSRGDLLAGIDVWSQDGLAIANYLPEIRQLRPLGQAKPENTA